MNGKLLPLIFIITINANIAFADVYQCANGEFRDTPCPKSNDGKKVDVYSPSANTNAGTNEQLSYDKFSKAIAVLDINRSLGYKCKSEITYKNAPDTCAKFKEKTDSYGDVEQAIATVKEYSKNNEFYEKNSFEVKDAFDNYKTIYNIKNFVDAYKKQ